MTIINAIKEFLSDEGLGTAGTDLFVGELPLESRDAFAIVAAISPEPDKAIPYYLQTFDIWARYAKYNDGYQKLQDIFDLLHRKAGYEMNGYYVYLSYSQDMIQDLGRDSERGHLFKASFSFKYRVSDQSS